MPNFSKPNVTGAIAAGFQIGSGIKDRESAEDEKKKQETLDAFQRIEDAAKISREMAITNVATLSGHAGEAAGKGATPEQLNEMRKAAQAIATDYAGFLEEARAFAKESGTIDPNIIPSGKAFVDQQMSIFDAAVQSASIQDESQQVVTLSPEEIKELSPELPEGSIVQRAADGKITLTFNPSDDPSTLQEEFDFLTEGAGIDPAIASGIVAQLYAVTYDPITREAFVMNKATGERVGDVPPPVEPTEAPPVVPEDIDPASATGVSGFGANILNTITDAIGQGAVAEDNLEATTAMNVVQQQTKLLMQAVVPGRPAKDIREGLALLTVTPNSIFQGEARAKSRMEATKRWLDTEIARMETMLAGKVSPTDQSTLSGNLGPLQEMSKSYETLIAAFGEEELDPEIYGPGGAIEQALGKQDKDK